MPDFDADETINRVTRRIHEGQDVYTLIGYVYGAAKLVYAEFLKRRNLMEALDEEAFIEAPSIGVEVEIANYDECLEHSLGCLGDEDREVSPSTTRIGKGKINCRKRLAGEAWHLCEYAASKDAPATAAA